MRCRCARALPRCSLWGQAFWPSTSLSACPPVPGGRCCDRLARRLLGRRASSVFSPPARLLLEATQYAQVRPYGLSRQAFGLLPKVREVDRLLSPSWQATVYEAHPELAFAALAGRPLAASKKTRAGRQARLHLLQSAPEAWLRQLGEALAALPPLPRSQAAPDDLLDAAVLTRTAYRIATGQATCLPPAPPRDARGLRMAIWY
ncbi:MAG: hypothetical protein KatS3mg131_2491 [Candidatus Tectimicrobiota bacterium]|nr:MAG: hypothetical protein KatS3mg131_2491 [Candidatus Tectomicrobia bacterium]